MFLRRLLRKRARKQLDTPVPALDALQAVMLVSKHLSTLLPFLLALRRVPIESLQRIGLLESLARDIANDGEFARDWYRALELLTGQDLSTRSVADLLRLSTSEFSSTSIGIIWRVASEIGLIDEDIIGQWVIFEGLTQTGQVERQRTTSARR